MIEGGIVMNRVTMLLTIIMLSLTCTFAQAGTLGIQLFPDAANPARPTMGDQMRYHSIITNAGDVPVEGLVAWISLVEIDSGHEQPMDLEDWSAQKAITSTLLGSGKSLENTWPMRLIQSGDYRVVIGVTARNQNKVYTSPTLEFHVTQKPVVESSRILLVSLGIPLLLIAALGFRRWQAGRNHKIIK
jgi:hypothetical protein